MSKVTFRNARGNTLTGIVQGTPGRRMVILCHGMLSSKDGPKHVALAAALSDVGIASLRFDFAGRGESEGSLYDLSLSGQVQDLDAAVGHLGTLGVQEVGVFGSSMGGTVAYLTAARDERIIALATLAAVGHPEFIADTHPQEFAAFMEQDYIETTDGRIGRAFLDDALSHDVLAAVAILRAPILVIHGEDDETVPCSDAHDIAAVARTASLELVAGADHEFSNPIYLRPVLQRITQFFQQHITA